MFRIRRIHDDVLPVNRSALSQVRAIVINRPVLLQRIDTAIRRNPVAALVGPRQCGKTTLAKLYAKTRHDDVQFFDLEDPVVQERFLNPRFLLQAS